MAWRGPHIIPDTTIQTQGPLEHLEILADGGANHDVGVGG